MHDLRTPMQAVVGALTALERADRIGDGERERLVASAVGFMRDIETELLRASFVFGQRLNERPMLLRDVVAEFHQVFDQMERRPHSRTRCHLQVGSLGNTLEADTRRVFADPLALRIVFMPIIENVLQYAGRARTANLVLSIAEQPGSVQLVIADDGPGVEEEVRRSLFEPGVRGRAARAHFPHGRGEGLSDARRVLQRMGGDLKLLERGPGTILACFLAWSTP